MRSKEVEEAIKSLNINKAMVLKGGDSCIASVDNIETVLSYIEELEKEVEKLKEHIRKRIAYTQDLEKDLFENCENYVVNKDKIRNKIKELEEDLKNYKEEYPMWCYDLECLEDIRVKEARINILKELLEE